MSDDIFETFDVRFPLIFTNFALIALVLYTISDSAYVITSFYKCLGILVCVILAANFHGSTTDSQLFLCLNLDYLASNKIQKDNLEKNLKMFQANHSRIALTCYLLLTLFLLEKPVDYMNAFLICTTILILGNIAILGHVPLQVVRTRLSLSSFLKQHFVSGMLVMPLFILIINSFIV